MATIVYHPTDRRTFKACRTCRQQKARCLFDEKPPCNRCRATGRDCVFEEIGKSKARLRRQAQVDNVRHQPASRMSVLPFSLSPNQATEKGLHVEAMEVTVMIHATATASAVYLRKFSSSTANCPWEWESISMSVDVETRTRKARPLRSRRPHPTSTSSILMHPSQLCMT